MGVVCVSTAGSGEGDDHSLDYRGENPTRGGTSVFEPDGEDPDPDESSDDENWNRQQSRVFQRTATLLKYWEARDYSVLWVTLTSSPTSKPADELSYSHQRLRQRIERARLAYCDGTHCPKHDEPTGHRLSHIDELEHLQIRTCEGPQGVIHVFWAWDRQRFRDGNHDRGLYLPQSWLSDQWADIHGPDIETESADPYLGPKAGMARMEALQDAVSPYIVDVRRYGPDATDGEHAPEHVAAYAASQYLGDHGEALEHLGWSHGRSLGGPLAETWEQLVALAESLDAAIDKWERLIAGERVIVKRGPEGDGPGVHSETVFKPPPDLGFEETDLRVVPPAEYRREQTTLWYFADGDHPGREWTRLSSDYETRRESYTSDTDEDREPPEWDPETPDLPRLEIEDDPSDEWFDGRCTRCGRTGRCTYDRHPTGGDLAVCARCLQFDAVHERS